MGGRALLEEGLPEEDEAHQHKQEDGMHAADQRQRAPHPRDVKFELDGLRRLRVTACLQFARDGL